jgi:hypothetical protein
MKWNPIETAPKAGSGLLYWKQSRHVEDATFYMDDDGNWSYMLFDGGTVNSRPTHWMPLPPPPEGV